MPIFNREEIEALLAKGRQLAGPPPQRIENDVPRDLAADEKIAQDDPATPQTKRNYSLAAEAIAFEDLWKPFCLDALMRGNVTPGFTSLRTT